MGRLKEKIRMFEAIHEVNPVHVGLGVIAVAMLAGLSTLNPAVEYQFSSGKSKANRAMAQSYGARSIAAYQSGKHRETDRGFIRLAHNDSDTDMILVEYSTSSIHPIRKLLTIEYRGHVEDNSNRPNSIDPSLIVSFGYNQYKCVSNDPDASCTLQTSVKYSNEDLFPENWRPHDTYGGLQKLDANMLQDIFAYIES